MLQLLKYHQILGSNKQCQFSHLSCFFLNNDGKQHTNATERINGQQMQIFAQFISLRMYYKRGK